MLTKERIEKLSISDNFWSGCIPNTLYFKRLYNNMHRFEKLVELDVDIQTYDEIQAMEHAAETCKSLNKAKFNFRYPRRGDGTLQPSRNISIDTISNFTPRSNIKSLKSVRFYLREDEILLYIIHKFPQLQNLDFVVEGFVNSVPMEDYTLSRLLNYLAKVDRYSISNLQVNENTINHIIGEYWESTSREGSENVKIVHSDKFNGLGQELLDLSKTKNSTKGITTLTYPVSSGDWEYMEFFEVNGKYVGNLQFSFSVADSPRSSLCAIPSKFLDYIFTECPNLRHMHLDYCVLKRDTYVEIDLHKHLSIHELFLNNCVLYPGALEQFSLLIPKVQQLRLCDITYHTDDSKPPETDESSSNSIIEIIMPHTKVGTILFEDKLYSGDTVYVKVFTFSKRSYSFYRVNMNEKGEIKVSNEDDFQAANNCKRYFICCQTKPKLQQE